MEHTISHSSAWVPVYLSGVVTKACNMCLAKKEYKPIRKSVNWPKRFTDLNGTTKLLSLLFCVHLLTACFGVKSETSQVLSRLGKRSTCSMFHGTGSLSCLGCATVHPHKYLCFLPIENWWWRREQTVFTVDTL